MSVLEIITPEDPVLRQVGEPVTNIKDPEIQTLIDDMIDTMRSVNGVGLAAPQVGRSLQLAVVETLPEHDEDGEEIPDSRNLYVIINPDIFWQSRKRGTGIEGCLSIPGYLGEVERHFAIMVTAYNREGKKKRLRLKGWDARIFQHEIDHLQGILYTDKLTAPENYWSEEEYEKLGEEEIIEE